MRLGNDFLWGVATSSYQVEGATREGGRGESIWDVFCRVPGKVYGNHNGDVACDQYHRYREDAALMRDIGVQAYRFSIAWPRVQPSGAGAVNRAGMDYYVRLVEELLGNGITPVATLYHWDLPAALQERGGWVERDTAFRFRDYAEACFRHLGALVPMWITLNEPWCVASLGYREGYHAPGHRSVAEMVRVIHHLNMAHGLAVACGRESGGGGVAASAGGVGAGDTTASRSGGFKIGTTLNLGVIRAATRREEDVEIADRCNDESRMYLLPLFGKGYPQRYVDYLASKHNAPLPLQAGDLEQIAQPLDFLGFNYYFEFVTAAERRAGGEAGTGSAAAGDTEAAGGGEAAGGSDAERMFHFNSLPRWEPTTDMGWHVVPDGLYRHLQWIKQEVGDIPIYITENGCALPDTVTPDNRVHDHKRIDYVRAHLKQIERAQNAGVDVRGYFLWSLLDNFEWGYGYSKRFGIIYCDYRTLERIPKDSYYFYRDCIAGYVE